MNPTTAPLKAAPMRLKFRSIWISDVHLGTAGCQAAYLLDFLKHTESEYLYLVGDIIDGWALKRSWYWQQTHNDVIQKLLRKARHGTRITYLPGNHDEAARQFLGLIFGQIRIENELVHTTADGRRFLVLHGDRFDGVVQCAKWLAIVGDRLYELTLALNRIFNRIRHRCGLGYWSLSQFLKHKVKTAVSFVSRFEEAVAAEAQSQGLDGVICGHIHKAEMREVGGVLYCNDGDWVESLTALVETETGELRIIDWQQLFDEQAASVLPPVTTEPEGVPA
ncbi:UDP-2,3-diacylglucosamine pyrophosphatase LpxH [Formivibrio citricus]|uniref:UDP-2,3-diacylglucosamine pyrophosphatase LpxH n=1 Tax=Formivibrio citricus TaxID=83765 RepID=A0A1I4XS10_9NEIS|nr:UDP-2,3-diacylglucosamine diphosphatase [Formivibrio citricus]SFN28645.1 UDP-2,3-diacylglucosamine pyrophosphatase LpxH [Formivibrio citricus]